MKSGLIKSNSTPSLSQLSKRKIHQTLGGLIPIFHKVYEIITKNKLLTLFLPNDSNKVHFVGRVNRTLSGVLQQGYLFYTEQDEGSFLFVHVTSVETKEMKMIDPFGSIIGLRIESLPHNGKWSLESAFPIENDYFRIRGYQIND